MRDTVPAATPEHWGSVVLAAIRDADLTVVEVSDLSGIPRSTLDRRVRGGTFLVDELACIADVIGVPVSVLAERVEQRPGTVG